MSTTIDILNQWEAGLITTPEAQAALETLNVHGAFNDEGYTGYDYTQQRWVVLDC